MSTENAKSDTSDTTFHLTRMCVRAYTVNMERSVTSVTLATYDPYISPP